MKTSQQQYLVEEELEHYRDGLITRREFVRRATLFGAAAASAAAMAQGIIPRIVEAAPAAQASPYSVAANDASVASEMISYTSTDGANLVAYRAWPAGASGNRSLPGIVVCHLNRGLEPHVMDIARRYAKQGYVVVAPDIISRLGSPTAELNLDQVMEAYRQLDDAQNGRDLHAAVVGLREHPAVNPAKTAAIGYCWGGDVIWRLATIDDALTVAAAYYGNPPPIEDVGRITAAVLGIYGGRDVRLNSTRPPLEEALNAAQVRYQMNTYGGAVHSFHNDSRPEQYNQEAAVQAFRDTLNWFARYLDLPEPTL